MDPLTHDECRVLGVLIEKAMTTPDLYPLTLNAVVAGCGQKNNRFPVVEFDEDRAYAALGSLREKKLVVLVEQSGARVSKYRHTAAEQLECRPAELALLSELLLRGPQTVGELRGRASRMTGFESTDAVTGFLRSMSEKVTPLVRRLPPTPGTRAEKYGQLLNPELHPVEGGAATSSASSTSATVSSAGRPSSEIDERIAALESELGELRAAVRRLAVNVGADDPFDGPEQTS